MWAELAYSACLVLVHLLTDVFIKTEASLDRHVLEAALKLAAVNVCARSYFWGFKLYKLYTFFLLGLMKPWYILQRHFCQHGLGFWNFWWRAPKTNRYCTKSSCVFVPSVSFLLIPSVKWESVRSSVTHSHARKWCFAVLAFKIQIFK